MADYWIKLYQEILDDPKMATLPDRLWRRTIELFLLAGKLCPDKSGKLPSTNQLAWLLRINSDDLQADITQLVTTGIIEPIPNGWLVVNFAKRQSAATVNDRVKQHRERKQKQEYYGDVTDLKRSVTQINRNRNRTETETETETEQNTSSGSIYKLYEREIGLLTASISEELKLIESEYPLEWIDEAIHEAALRNARNLKYIMAILKRWKAEGKSNGKPSGKKKTRILTDAQGNQIEEVLP